MSNMFNKEMVRLRRLELPRGISPTATSTLRVYQFRHSRTGVTARATGISSQYPIPGGKASLNLGVAAGLRG